MEFSHHDTIIKLRVARDSEDCYNPLPLLAFDVFGEKQFVIITG